MVQGGVWITATVFLPRLRRTTGGLARLATIAFSVVVLLLFLRRLAWRECGDCGEPFLRHRHNTVARHTMARQTLAGN